MAARKRKIAPTKQATETEAEPLADARLGEGEPAPDSEPDAETLAPPPESGEAEPLGRIAPEIGSDSEMLALDSDADAPDSDADAPDSDADAPDSDADAREALLGEGTSEIDESRVDDTGAYLKGLLEALLFVSDHPLEIKDLARAAKIDKKRAEELVLEIRNDFQNRGVRLDEIGDGYAFRSNPAYSEYVRGYLSLKPVRLSRAQLETLSIVAYRQPITRPEVDDIRGVDAGPVLKGLLERDLVRIIGKKDEPGRPMLYGTTQTFLQVFSLKSLRDLPTLREFTELNDESRKTFEEELGEEAPEGPVSFEDAMAADATADGEATPESGELGAESEARVESEASEAEGAPLQADAAESEQPASDAAKDDEESDDADDEDDDEDDADDEDEDDEDDDDEDDDEDDDDDDEEPDDKKTGE
jgi:segregation and condensation protein B